jgi:coenzyme F420-0:L-glutamate ligase/coenzyme F420-1:gamma-L-glutamate ligase
MSRTSALEILAVPGLPMIKPGDDLAALIAEGFARGGIEPRSGDVLAVAQKVVSKSEGRSVDLATVAPSAQAIELAKEIQKDPRLVELILSESVRVVRSRPNVLIVEHRLGFVMANAGIDQSNVAPGDGVERALLLPVDPDGSAEALRAGLAGLFGVPPAVIITDSFGRPFRRGTAGVAIGAAGLPALLDLRGNPDLFGRILQVSISGFADEIAAAASLVMGQGDEAQPVVLVRGLSWQAPANPASNLVRPASEDMFR